MPIIPPPILKSLAGLVALIIVGCIGYRVIEGWPWFDCLYMTVITLSTTGFGEIGHLGTMGRTFTMVVLLMGMGLMAYFVTNLSQFIVEGKLYDLWGRQRMRERIKSMHGHYIICGAGTTGMVVGDEFLRRGIPFVVIDQDAKVVEDLRLRNFMVIDGDATLDETLAAAGLAAARGLITALQNDADNVFVTLTAKGMNPAVFVVSSAKRQESVAKLKRAGANYVVTPNTIGGHRMASVILRPSVVDFLDVAMAGEAQDFQMEEIVVEQGSALENRAIRDADLRRRSGAIIVSVKQNGKTYVNPEPTLVFNVGDRLIVLGDGEQIERMCQIARAPGGRGAGE